MLGSYVSAMTPQRWRKLQAFHLVMRTGSVTQAAEALSISQPAVSKLLQSLESDTKLTLFDRARRRLLPTASAARLHAEVDRLFRMASGIDQLAHEIRMAGRGELRVAALPLLGSGLLPAWCAQFARQHPGLRTSLMVKNSQSVLRTVAEGEADVGIAHASPHDPIVTRRLLASLPAVVVLPPRHRLATRRQLTPRDLAGERFISLGPQDDAALVDSLFESHGVARQLAFETNLAGVACSLAAEGAGVAMVNLLAASGFGRRLIVRPIVPTVHFRLDVLTTPGSPTSELANRFIRLITDRLAALGATVPE